MPFKCEFCGSDKFSIDLDSRTVFCAEESCGVSFTMDDLLKMVEEHDAAENDWKNPQEPAHSQTLDSDSERFEIEGTILKRYRGFQADVFVRNGITEIGNAFKNLDYVKRVSLPPGLKKIGADAFSACTALTSVSLPDSVEEIGEYAFYGCKSLKYIEIPESVTRIQDFAFGGCSSLEYVVIPEGVQSIGDFAFEDCISLEYVEIPETVTYIGDSAFESCEELEQVEIPEAVTYIGRAAFKGCADLKKVEMTEGVTYIGEAAFENCVSLKGIIIPDSVEEIGELAFKNCVSLEEKKVEYPSRFPAGTWEDSSIYKTQYEKSLSQGICPGCNKRLSFFGRICRNCGERY